MRSNGSDSVAQIILIEALFKLPLAALHLTFMINDGFTAKEAKN